MLEGVEQRHRQRGDWNSAHKEIDLRNWRSNQKNSGFLPEERARLSAVFDERGWAVKTRAGRIYKNDRRFSDHAPLIIDCDFEL